MGKETNSRTREEASRRTIGHPVTKEFIRKSRAWKGKPHLWQKRERRIAFFVEDFIQSNGFRLWADKNDAELDERVSYLNKL